MAKTKFFRVAVEGDTVDGRKIERAHIDQMAADYDPETYTAVISCEHLRGYSPTPPFNSYGHVAALRAQTDEIRFGPKSEKCRALYAQFEVNDQAKEVNRAGQKLFSSIEVNPVLPRTGRAYLLGCAITDSPASMATQVLKFSRDDKRKDNLIALCDEGFEIEFEEEAASAASEVTSAFAEMKTFFTSLTAPKPEPETKPETKPAATGDQPDLAAFGATMAEGMDKIATAFADATAKMEARVGKLTEDFNTFKADIEKVPASKYNARPTATGGGDRIRARC